MKNTIPILIQRCLAYGIEIYPFQIGYIMNGYRLFRIPDKIVKTMKRERLIKYINALYLSQQYGANEWSRGREMLKELGFIEIEIDSRTKRLIWNKKGIIDEKKV